MKILSRKLMLSAVALAASAFLTSGPPTAVGAAAASLASPAGLELNADAVILVKDGPGGFKCCGNGGGGGIPPGPGGFKDGGGKGGKGGKGGDHHHHWGPGIAGGIILGVAHCAIQSERCEERHGEDTDRYWRCMRRSGC